MADYGEEITSRVAERFRETRTSRGLSLEAVAEEAGLHRTTIGLVERGKTGITISAASRVARALGLSLGDLIKGAERDLASEDRLAK